MNTLHITRKNLDNANAYAAGPDISAWKGNVVLARGLGRVYLPAPLGLHGTLTAEPGTDISLTGGVLRADGDLVLRGGDLFADNATILGHLDVEGSVTALSHLGVGGYARIEDNAFLSSFRARARLDVGGDLVARRDVEAPGGVKCGGSLYAGGAVRAGAGVVSAGLLVAAFGSVTAGQGLFARQVVAGTTIECAELGVDNDIIAGAAGTGADTVAYARFLRGRIVAGTPLDRTGAPPARHGTLTPAFAAAAPGAARAQREQDARRRRRAARAGAYTLPKYGR